MNCIQRLALFASTLLIFSACDNQKASFRIGTASGYAPYVSCGPNGILNIPQLTISQGIHFIVAPSGCGKTTFLNCLSGLLPYQGDIKIRGQSVQSMSRSERAKTIGFVFQELGLFPHMTAEANCVQPLCVVDGQKKAQCIEKVDRLFKQLRISELKQRYPSQLSGGQKQRVAIARTLAKGTSVLLLDEPTAALDSQNIARFQEMLRLVAAQGVTIVVVTHDQKLIAGCADNVIYLQKVTK